MKRNISNYIATISIICSILIGCNSNVKHEDIYTIDINHNKINVDPICDISFAFTDDLEIIQLENNDNALLSYSSRFYIHNGDIYFTDQDMMNGAIYRFNSEGKFINTIGKSGRGPGEIIFSDNFSFMNDSIFFYDHFSQKCIIYNKDGNGYREIPFSSETDSIVNLPLDKFAFINDKMAILTYPDMATHNLMTCNIYTNEIKSFIPTDSISAQYGWGDDDGTILDKDAFYFTLWNNDTLYRFDGDKVEPLIYFNITNRTPQDIMKLGLFECNDYESNNNTISNVNVNGVTPNFLCGHYTRGQVVLRFIHDFQTNSTKSSTSSFIIINDGGLRIMGRELIYDNKIYWACSPSVLKVNIPTMLKHGKFTNPETRKKLEQLLAAIDEDDNPVIFVKEFKR